MKKLLLILLCLPMIGFGQLTYVPDDNFEQELINLGYDNVLDDHVFTTNINTITLLDVSNQNIADLTGIEDFTAIIELDCENNLLQSINISQNTNLQRLNCMTNQITVIDLSLNSGLLVLQCGENLLTSLDLTSLTLLTTLECHQNQLSTIDLSNQIYLDDLLIRNNQLNDLILIANPALLRIECQDNLLIALDVSYQLNLINLECQNNSLSELNLQNGNNINMLYLQSYNNNLTCVQVDNANYSTQNWPVGISPSNFAFDATVLYSNNCSGTAIQEHTTNKEILKVTDLLGRETKGKKNEPLFYIYDDGTVEKRIVIE